MRIMLICFVLVLIASSFGCQGQSGVGVFGGDATVRHDGIYYHQDTGGHYHYLRFYPDKTALMGSSSLESRAIDVAYIKKWMTVRGDEKQRRENPHIHMTQTYAISGKKLTLTQRGGIISGKLDVPYTIVSPTKLETYISEGGSSTRIDAYEFMSIDFPPE